MFGVFGLQGSGGLVVAVCRLPQDIYQRNIRYDLQRLFEHDITKIDDLELK